MKHTLFVLIALCIAAFAFAEPAEFAVKGFTFTFDVTVPGSAEATFVLMTGDVSGWWDHHMSDQPKALYIEPKPGGGFYEIFDEAGHGVRHAEVTYAEQGKRLRMEGPLGLAGRAFHMVTTWDYEAAGDSTRVTCTVNMSGQIDAEKAAVVEGVWKHFLIEQFKPWAEGKKNQKTKN